MSAVDLGIYVHIPFCAERCDYCAFVTTTGNDHLHQRYVDAVVAEIAATPQPRPATSVFFGGGTPSRLHADQVAQVLRALDLAPGSEITLEMNPEDVTGEKLTQLVAIGVTRVSVGIQSTSSPVLIDLGRTHRGDSVQEIAEIVDEAGLASWSMDLIIGSSAERDVDLLQSIADVLDQPHPPPHLSSYLLSAERGTPLGRAPERHPDDDVLAERYELLDRELLRRGYRWYEISNFSLPGHECRHNQLYWRQGEYLGFGVAAHGHLAGRRRWNVANLMSYLQRVEEGDDPIGGAEVLDGEQAAFERLALELRMSSGVPRWSLDDDAATEGLVVEVEDRWVLTKKGRLLADEVARRLRLTEGTTPLGR